MQIKELVEEFLADVGARRAASTQKFYRGRLKPFVAAFGDREFSTLKLREIMSYLAAVGALQSDSTRRHNAVALESLQKFARTERHIKQRVFRKLPKPAMGTRDRLPTAEETAALLAKAPAAFIAIYTALRQSGARPGELCRAQISDIDRIKGVIVLKQHKTAAKTGKPRRIPIGGKLKLLIDQAIGVRTEGAIFLSPSGKPWQVANLSRTYTRLRKAAGLTDGLCLYLARHECGSAICKSQGIEAARRILGHSNAQTTTRYVHYDDAELQAIQDKMEASLPLPPPAASPDPASPDPAPQDSPPAAEDLGASI